MSDLGVTIPSGFDAQRPKPTSVPMRFLPQMSLVERDQRWRALREAMDKAGIAAAIFVGSDYSFHAGLANIRYIFQAASEIASVALFFGSGLPVVWNDPPHMNRPYNFLHSTQNWVTDIRPYGGMAVVAAELWDRGFDRSRIGLVSASSGLFPSSILAHEERALRKALPNVDFVDLNPLMEVMRLVKSKEEISMLRQAGRIARKVLDAAVSVATPGTTEAELYAEMERAKIIGGGEPDGFNLLSSGPVEHPAEENWHLLHGLDRPLVPSQRKLANGDIVISEWHTRFGGYNVHSEYTIYVGKTPPAELAKIFAVCVECLDAAKDVLRPGTTMREAWQAISAPAARADLAWVEVGLHGHGLTSPEFPAAIREEHLADLGPLGQMTGDVVLAEGMCFGTGFDLHNPRWKADVGCILGETFVVRPGGGEALVDVPRTIGTAG